MVKGLELRATCHDLPQERRTPNLNLKVKPSGPVRVSGFGVLGFRVIFLT